MSEFHERLIKYLTKKARPFEVQELTPDASTREYFRVVHGDSTSIACVYPESFLAAEQSYLDVTKLFLKADLPVAKIEDFDELLGVILIEDLGDTILRDVLVESTDANKDLLLDKAIGLIAKIQAATKLAFDESSVASRLRFDEEKLLWELDFFREHYFSTYLKRPLPDREDAALREEFIEISRELESRASVLCHRDFHAANLMIDSDGELRIIDHQDARIGSPSYDLVSLLLDRVTVPPSAEWLAEKRKFFLAQRDLLGLDPLSEDDFTYEFRLQTIQRCLKAVGTFSFQSANRGKTYFEPYIKPMFQIVLRTLGNLERFPTLKGTLGGEI